MKEIPHTIARVAERSGRPLWQVQSAVYALLTAFPEPVVILDRGDVAAFPGAMVLTPQAAHLVLRRLNEALNLPHITRYVAHAHAITGTLRIDIIDTRTVPVKTGDERVDSIPEDGDLDQFSAVRVTELLTRRGWMVDMEALLSPQLQLGWWSHRNTAGRVIAYTAPVERLSEEAVMHQMAIIRELIGPEDAASAWLDGPNDARHAEYCAKALGASEHCNCGRQGAR